jgi:hypothetical protein
MAQLLMPKATAVWLIDNTTLTFKQIGDFCQLHELEVKGIADGDVATGIKGMDPIVAGQLTRDELARGEADSRHKLILEKQQENVPVPARRKGPRYTPVSRRQDRPDAIAWLVRNHPELSDAQVSKLVGTTKPTIQAIRDRTHWNSANIKPVDPVTLGLCSQIELDAVVAKAHAKLERQAKKHGGAALKPTEESLQESAEAQAPAATLETQEEQAAREAPKTDILSTPVDKPSEEQELDADSVFANLGKSKPEE